VVTDVPENMPRIEELIESLDMKVPQVLIQADIVETDASFGRQLGVEIGGANGELASFTGPARLISYPTTASHYSLFPGVQDLTGATITSPVGGYGGNPNSGTFFGLLSFQQLTVLLRAIETNGKGKYLARPKILTLNNKSAEISLTADTVVGVQSASLIAQSGLLTTTAERQKTGVVLRVTPQVNDGGMVTLLIEPSVTRPQASQFFSQFVDAQSQSVRTSVRIRDGSTLMIGGLLSDQTTVTVRKVPFLGSIPVIGRLFTSENKQTSKMELMIFITPTLVKD
jgi:type II secretory pathway component GspD/PulD (secretin)